MIWLAVDKIGRETILSNGVIILNYVQKESV